MFAEGLALADKLGDAGARAQILIWYADQRWALAGDADAGLALAREALELAEASGDREVQSYCHMGLAFHLYHAGHPREALPSADRGLELAVTDGKLRMDALDDPNIHLLIHRGNILISLARLEESAEELARGLGLARAEGDREAVAFAKLSLGMLAFARGDTEVELRWAREAVDVAERLGSPMVQIAASNELAAALVRNEQWREAREVAERLWPIARFIPVNALWNRSVTALASAGLGDVTNARSAAEEALDYADRFPSLRWMAAYSRLYAAEALLSVDGKAAAERIERELDAVETVIEEVGIESHRPLLHERRAQLAEARGDDAALERHLREAHRLYTEMGATGHAERLARELVP